MEVVGLLLQQVTYYTLNLKYCAVVSSSKYFNFTNVICNLCYLFLLKATIEGAMFVKYNKVANLSSQSLMDCSWGFVIAFEKLKHVF